jgi:hypothetical protein
MENLSWLCHLNVHTLSWNICWSVCNILQRQKIFFENIVSIALRYMFNNNSRVTRLGEF